MQKVNDDVYDLRNLGIVRAAYVKAVTSVQGGAVLMETQLTSSVHLRAQCCSQRFCPACLRKAHLLVKCADAASGKWKNSRPHVIQSVLGDNVSHLCYFSLIKSSLAAIVSFASEG